MPAHILKQAVKLLGKNADEVVQGPLLPKTGKYFAKPPKVQQFKGGKATKRLVNDPVQDQANQIEYLSTKGKRKAGEVNFIDDQGNTSYLNKTGDRLQYTNLNTKKKNNGKLATRRAKDADDQTLMPDADFYKGTPAGKEAHHIAGLDQWGWVYDGLNRGDKMALTAMLEKANIPMGNNPFNRADLSSQVHDQLHTWMASKGMKGRKKNALGKMPLEDRMEYVQQVIKEYRQSMEKMYELVMIEKYGKVIGSQDKLLDSMRRLSQPEMAIYERS